MYTNLQCVQHLLLCRGRNEEANNDICKSTNLPKAITQALNTLEISLLNSNCYNL